MQIEPFHEPVTATLSYVVYDARERVAVVIDPVLDYDPASARRSSRSVEQIAAFLDEHRLRVPYVLDTHAHADHGTARCDFPGGDAATLHASITKLYALYPPETRVFTGHDYRPGGRGVAFESTLGEQRAKNVQLSATTACEDFVAFRRQRDATLGVPALMIPSIQLNLRAGELPAPEANGVAYLRLPLDRFGH